MTVTDREPLLKIEGNPELSFVEIWETIKETDLICVNVAHRDPLYARKSAYVMLTPEQARAFAARLLDLADPPPEPAPPNPWDEIQADLESRS